MLRVVVAAAELDVASASRFASDLLGAGSVVVDCSQVEFIDSSGLQVLLEARQRVVGDGERLLLRDPSAVLLRLLTVTSTRELFTIEG